jgi:hypothetical protein
MDILESVQERLKQIREYVWIKDVGAEEESLASQLTLGDDWDNPFKLSKALDQHSAIYARWASVLKRLKNARNQLQLKKDAWESEKREQIAGIIFEENVAAGMTASNAKPTEGAIKDRFKSVYLKTNDKGSFTDEESVEFIRPVVKIDEAIDTIEPIVKALELRKDMLMSMGSLVRAMIDNQLFVYRKKKPKQEGEES